MLQIGIPLQGMNWILGCISSTNFSLLINGSPSGFFASSRGVREGCPLSPILFILVIEGLGLLIKDAIAGGLIRGINISTSLTLTHLLFVNDVVLFGLGIVLEWMAFEVILETFCAASGMCISVDKSSFLFNALEAGVLENIHLFLPYTAEPMHKGFKYLGYYIKPLGYGVKDWLLLLKSFEKRIRHWSYKLLSLGGRG